MNIVLLKYQTNFADNLSELAYGKIMEFNSEQKCYFENDNQQRKKFEFIMRNFNMDYRYISKNQVSSVVDKSYLFTRKLITSDKISKELNKKVHKDKILDIKHFKIDDINRIDESIKQNFSFKNFDFIINYDLLDEIQSTNSIGLYLNSSFENVSFILKAVERLNKYLKKPKLFIFSNSENLPFISELCVKYKVVNIPDWREEFYFLTQCKNKIISSNINSYSIGFWATILNKSGYLTAFDRQLNPKQIPENWIAI